MGISKDKGLVVMVFPRSGGYDHIIKDLPLSLLYAARPLVKDGYRVEIIDQRVEPSWRERLRECLDMGPLYVGVSAMTGRPIKYAIEVSRFVRENSNVPVVWGGIHPTIEPKTTLSCEYVDMLVRGSGEACALRLARALESEDLGSLRHSSGICYKDGKDLIINPTANYDRQELKGLPFPPYELTDLDRYFRFTRELRLFSLVTSYGCPHGCSFCYSPSFSDRMWVAEAPEVVLNHLDHIMSRYEPDYVSIIDSDFFVDLERVKEILRRISKRDWELILGFRGVRIDEIRRFDGELYRLMKAAGVKHLHIGAESGSDRILKSLGKRINREMIVEANKKLAEHDGLVPVYNLIAGVPGERYEELLLTGELILELLEDNPRAQIASVTQYTPYPGTGMYRDAVARGFSAPESLEEWIDFDQEDSSKLCPWVDGRSKRQIDMMTFTVYFVDPKFQIYFSNDSLLHRLIRLAARLYRPIARFRLKRHFARFPIEMKLKNALMRKM